MNSIKELRDAIRKGINDLVDNRERDALQIAGDQLALIKLRIQTSGENSTGAAFTAYTSNYAKQRVKAGFQAAYVDFTRTGRMWANIRPQVIDSSVFSCRVEVKATLPNEQVKLEANSKRRGNILEPTQDEIDIVRKANRSRIKKYFNF
jgi:hypothetical protein